MTTLTIPQAARALGEHPDTLRRWIRTEQCPIVRIGRKVRIPAEWVAQQPEGLKTLTD